MRWHAAAILSLVALVFSLGAAKQLAFYTETNSNDFNALNAFEGSATPNIELPYDSRMQGFSTGDAAIPTVEQLIARQNGSFLQLTHREIPGTSVRIKRHAPRREKQIYKQLKEGEVDPEAFCDDTVASWTGYIDTIDGKSLFFFFFESRSNPEKDPVVFWTNGGPGGSSALGLFMELGPCRVPLEHREGAPINGTDHFEYSWNNRANVIFVEQPASEKKNGGVGYSYRRFGPPVSTTDQAAVDVYHFLRIFFSAFDKFKDNDFHLAGESYGGHYIPRFATEVMDRNQRVTDAARKAGEEPDESKLINLKSIVLGNPIVDNLDQRFSFYSVACTKQAGYGKPRLPISTCKQVYEDAQRCMINIKKYCYDSFSETDCRAHHEYCEDHVGWGLWVDQFHLNPYDASDDCKAGFEPDLCYAESGAIARYLDREDVRSLLGARSRNESGTYAVASSEVAENFQASFDALRSSKQYVAGLLERDLRVLVYVGSYDVVCNWIGNLEWVNNLEYEGAIDFKRGLKGWMEGGKEVGLTATGGNLTYATVTGAGHMVPFKKHHAKSALAMINRWLDGQSL